MDNAQALKVTDNLKQSKFKEKPKVSIIIPCRNEEKFIKSVLTSVLSQSYPKDKMEVLIVDGLSEDRTPIIVKEFSRKVNLPRIKLLINKSKHVPYAMNLGIRNSTGEIILRMDAHSEYPRDYVEKLVWWLKKLKADNVGGVVVTVPRLETIKARAIASALSSTFGVGNSVFRVAKNLKTPIEVDTVPFGCYPRKIFEKVGLYNEKLIRNQDIELNKRIKKAGGKIYLVPDVKIKYYCRDNWSKLWKNNFENGKWVILTAYYTKDFSSLSPRHFIPFFFITYLLTLPFFSFKLKLFYSVVPLLLYIFLNFIFSLLIAWKNKKWKLFPYLIVSFIVLHISYGLGSLFGIGKVVKEKLKRMFFKK